MHSPLQLSPLPTCRDDDPAGWLLMEREGFVDEAVVSALVSEHHSTRVAVYQDDLALAADDLDFAGWRLPRSAPVRSAEVPPAVIDAIVRRAAPPSVRESGLGEPHQGGHRWWLAGLAGVLSTMLFSVLLLSLAARNQVHPETPVLQTASIASKPVESPPAAPVPAAPELTEISPAGR